MKIKWVIGDRQDRDYELAEFDHAADAYEALDVQIARGTPRSLYVRMKVNWESKES